MTHEYSISISNFSIEANLTIMREYERLSINKILTNIHKIQNIRISEKETFKFRDYYN